MGNELTETLETAFWKDFHIVFWNNYETRKVDLKMKMFSNFCQVRPHLQQFLIEF
uniref:Uncharacterized protein n=1 Tax=Anguilla anguilla TaxID=7936 RepID=A0A0E9P9G7_ANGAN